ncbi:tyrosine--tRNA ligase [Varunaivibrio sulfuroxidans]|uniref:Tyrosine--tRNA ligase n=1 Tax=Varunaivibrio sulfuroxidans TaxID=1773489 RepID=A0A4V2UNI4_9PROT|nr:tyrosine--tRNA ligase [Varunaivibrio sulfuroxidans]TCS62161.1 tyrosyl-tRNA synthetase [Varunaivibrio sulfuroxidans]WES30590.1 tyrosine--tRNA ligase [Varunaivibrio sulfuroxidans]
MTDQASPLKSDFLRIIAERGYMHQCTDLDALDSKAVAAPITAYIGFDCTAASLHVGSLLPIMMLRILQKSGHKPIILMGGGTTKVGDPSGKDEGRKLLDEETIHANMAGIKGVFSNFLNFGDGPTDAVMVNNDDWLADLKYIDFLRDYGRHFSVNRMLGFESVKLRLDREQPLSFLEFNYMIFQAYDFLELARRNDCVLQMGGSDQWGNIVNGVELARRVDGREVFGLTTPLLTTASGAKMGKTAAGAVWLNAEMLSPYDYWQYWRNTEDGDVGRFLRLFTELPLTEIARLERLEGAEINDAKKVLAFEATRLCHGEAEAEAAAQTARRTFEEGALATDLPTVEIAAQDIANGIAAFDILRLSGLCASGGEARRLIKGGGARINDRPVTGETQRVCDADITTEGVIKVSAGKKRHILIKPV